MDDTMLFKDIFSIISNLLGSQKWALLPKELGVYPEETFDEEIAALNKKYRKTSDKLYACLTRWRLQAGTTASVNQVITALRDIQVGWLADHIERHMYRGEMSHPTSTPCSTASSNTNAMGTKHMKKPPNLVIQHAQQLDVRKGNTNNSNGSLTTPTCKKSPKPPQTILKPTINVLTV